MLSKIESPEFLKLELELDKKIRRWRQADEARYSQAGKKSGGRYLSNKQVIQKTKLYKLATKAPKGGHLHIHFNSCLKPNVLLDIATEDPVKKMMYISLPGQKGQLTKKNIRDVKGVKFHFMGTPDPQPTNVWVGDVFAEDYGKLTNEKKDLIGPDRWIKKDNERIQKEINDLKRHIAANMSCIQKRGSTATAAEKKWFQDKKNTLESKKTNLEMEQGKSFEERIKLDERMLFSKFLEASNWKEIGVEPMAWLRERLVFSERDVTYKAGTDATCKEQWALFDKRTQMMAGLFNNEHAYREYTRQLLDSLRDENIQYAEIRPNFMNKNQVFTKENPNVKMNNRGIVACIVDEYEKWKSNKPDFGGLKVIYCTPRVFEKEEIKKSLRDCFDLKLDPKYGKYIAGFDIIGPENADNPLMFFKEELEEFRAYCNKAKVECPFLFHAGESHSDRNGNLDVALKLEAKRIAHGYAIPQKTSVFNRVKERGEDLCIECCPISNEILGLHPLVNDAVVYNLMKENVPCALASDNPTLFNSTLSHDFYQFMIGKKPGEEGSRLQDWKKLIMDSLHHAVWNSDKERDHVLNLWSTKWEKFVNDAVADPNFLETTRPVSSSTTIKPEPTAATPNSDGRPAPRSTAALQQTACGPSPMTPPTRPPTQKAPEKMHTAAPTRADGGTAPSGTGTGPNAQPIKSSGTSTTSTTAAKRDVKRPGGAQASAHGGGNAPPIKSSSTATSTSASRTQANKTSKSQTQTRRPQGP